MNRILLSAGACLFSLSLAAQQNTVATGGDATGTGGSVSFTVGQIDYVSPTGTDGNLNEGVQQPYEFFKDVGIATLDWDVQLYPNPTNEFIVLEVEQLAEDLNYVLVDAKGSIVAEGAVTTTETMIEMRQFATGSYMLQLTQHEQIISSTKIIKH